MKSTIFLFSMVVLFISPALAQDMQYVSSQSGDTLWVKDSYEYGDNSLYLLMQSDSLAPATRVYFLKSGGVYGVFNNPSTSKTQRTIIMGPEQNLKTGSAAVVPPIISGAPIGTGVSVFGGMVINKDLLVKNINLEIGNPTGNNGGWAWFSFNGPNMRLEVENCIMEHTWWTWVGNPPAESRVFFKNCYFVNLNGHICRRNGGVVDFNSSGATHQDTLLVENCTHVNTQGTLYKFRFGYAVDRVIFNHNNFIDCAGYVFMNNGNQTNMSVTNNIFVNCQLQAYAPPFDTTDAGEVDMEGLPMGLVNLRVDSTFNANGKNFYADKNLAYWDPSLSDIVPTLNSNAVNGSTEWLSQMILMNTRTQALFNDDAAYPLLINGTWITDKLPNFADTDVLFTDQLDIIKAYAIAAVDVTYETPMPSWRQPGNRESTNFIYADWPIPIDLSYTDSDLLTAGLGGFPVGDLGWFTTQYAEWMAQRDQEYSYIGGVLNGSIQVNVHATQEPPQKFQLQQNFPNPFNPSTTISFSILKEGHVTLRVFDILGREVETLVDGFKAAQFYTIKFEGTALPNGVYLYRLEEGNNIVTKKMILLK